MDDDEWQRWFIRDFGEDKAPSKAHDITWRNHYVRSLHVDAKRSVEFSQKITSIIYEELNDSLDALSELVLDGDAETTKYQIDREEQRDNSSRITSSTHPYLIHFAVHTADLDSVKLFIDKDVAWVNKRVTITNFTPLHLAVFHESIPIIQLLLDHGADPSMKDSYNGTPLDYARMLGLTDIMGRGPSPPRTIKVYDPRKDSDKVVVHDIAQVEKLLDVQFTTGVVCGWDYIAEIMFSGFSIEPDEAFRRQYGTVMERSSGDDQVVLAWISDSVGWGVFAARDFSAGEFVLRYGGKIARDADIHKEHVFNLMISFEGFGLDASRHRNLGGMVNHSSRWCNAETQCIFEHGAEQAIITATKHIRRGQQVLLDYSDSYWGADEAGNGTERSRNDAASHVMVELGGDEPVFPHCLPPSVLASLD